MIYKLWEDTSVHGQAYIYGGKFFDDFYSGGQKGVKST